MNRVPIPRGNAKLVAKLVSQIEAEYGKPGHIRSEHGLTESEGQFFRRALEQGHEVCRSGWPDFLIKNKQSGKTYAVEVKSPTDPIRPSQKAMFAMLEAHGIAVYIWTPTRPDRLVRWQTHQDLKSVRGNSKYSRYSTELGSCLKNRKKARG